jgi:two-component system, NarL family, nitrate/nitrite response regulator NarL
VKILIADDHPLYREAVSLQVRRLYQDAQIEQLASLPQLHAVAAAPPPPDLMLVDFHMPGMSIEALAALIAEFPKVPLAVISGMARAADIRAAVQAGARAYIPKTSTPDYFAQVLQMLLAGGTSIPADILLESTGDDSGWELSTREREVLKGVALGQSNKEIGRDLGLAEVTIKLHLRNLFRKMGARSRAEVAVMAVRAGLE